MPLVKGQDVGLHGHDAVDVDFRVDELQKQAVQKAVSGAGLLDLAGAAEGLPGQVEQVQPAGNQHGGFDFGNERRDHSAKECADQHYDGKTGQDAEVEGQRPAKALPAPVGHGHDVVRAWRDGCYDCVGKKRNPVEHN